MRTRRCDTRARVAKYVTSDSAHRLRRGFDIII